MLEDRATAVAYRAAVTPDVRFLDPDGNEIARMRLRKPGARWDTAAVLAQMRDVAARHGHP